MTRTSKTASLYDAEPLMSRQVEIFDAFGNETGQQVTSIRTRRPRGRTIMSYSKKWA